MRLERAQLAVERPRPLRVALIDASGRGGLLRYALSLAGALRVEGVDATLITSRNAVELPPSPGFTIVPMLGGEGALLGVLRAGNGGRVPPCPEPYPRAARRCATNGKTHRRHPASAVGRWLRQVRLRSCCLSTGALSPWGKRPLSRRRGDREKGDALPYQ